MSDFLKNIERTRKQSAYSEKKSKNLNDSLDLNKKHYNLEGMGDNRTPDEYATDKLIEHYYVDGSLREESYSDPNSKSPSEVYGTDVKEILIYLFFAILAFYIFKKIINKLS